MSGVHATTADLLNDSVDPTTRFLDTLYDITATGVEPGGGVALSEIEVFLHEHARSPKSLTDFQTFFAQHGLTTRSEQLEPGLPRILEPLPAVEPPPPALGAPAVPDDDEDDVTRPGTLGAPAVRRGASGMPASLLMVACAVLLLLAGGTAAYTIVALGEMRAEIARTQAQSADNHSAIEKLDTEADQIRGGLFDTGSAMRRVEEKNDLLLEALLPTPVQRP